MDKGVNGATMAPSVTRPPAPVRRIDENHVVIPADDEELDAYVAARLARFFNPAVVMIIAGEGPA